MRSRVPNHGEAPQATAGAHLDEVLDAHLEDLWPFATALVPQRALAVDVVAAALCELARSEAIVAQPALWSLSAVARQAKLVHAVPRGPGDAALAALGWRLQVAVWAVEVQLRPLEPTSRALSLTVVEVVRAHGEVLDAFGWAPDGNRGDLLSVSPFGPGVARDVRAGLVRTLAHRRASKAFQRAGWSAAAVAALVAVGFVGLSENRGQGPSAPRDDSWLVDGAAAAPADGQPGTGSTVGPPVRGAAAESLLASSDLLGPPVVAALPPAPLTRPAIVVAGPEVIGAPAVAVPVVQVRALPHTPPPARATPPPPPAAASEPAPPPPPRAAPEPEPERAPEPGSAPPPAEEPSLVAAPLDELVPDLPAPLVPAPEPDQELEPQPGVPVPVPIEPVPVEPASIDAAPAPDAAALDPLL